MPPALISHASMPGSASNEPREVAADAFRLGARIPKEKGEVTVCPTDDEAAVPRPKKDSDSQKKRSLDYVWRSGVAGGLAGCAVCLFDSSTFHRSHSICDTTMRTLTNISCLTGQNCCRTA